MSNTSGNPVRNTPVARNRYAEGQILHARDLERESDYFLARERQHNALVHGPGIITGLQLIAFERGTEKAVQLGSLTQPKNIDVMITPGAAIDTTGRFIVVPKRVPLSLDYANRGGTFADDTYRVDLLYAYGDEHGSKGGNGTGCDGASASAGGGKVTEAYRIELTKYDPNAALPQLDRGAVLDGPIDDPTLCAAIVLGTVDWNGKDNYVGYSWTGRAYIPITAERVATPDQRAEVELRDDQGRLAFRTSVLPAASAQDPFTPINMKDRFRVDADGNVWVPTEVSVGKEGVRLRQESDPAAPEASNWRIRTEVSADGVNFGKKAGGKEDLQLADPYALGRRELRVEFQREGLGEGGARVVIGHVDQNGGNFEPAVVVYDRPHEATGSGASTVEIWGDLRVRGTAFLQGAGRIPPDGTPPSEQLDLLLRQLAGPFAGAFKLFLTTDPQWLADFAAIMVKQVQGDPTLNAQFVSAVSTVLLNDNNFKQAVANTLNSVIDNKVGIAAADAVSAALQDTGKMTTALHTMADALDVNTGAHPLPNDTGARLVAALIRRLLRNFPGVRDSVYNAMDAGAEQTAVRQFFNSWITGLSFPPVTVAGVTIPGLPFSVTGYAPILPW